MTADKLWLGFPISAGIILSGLFIWREIDWRIREWQRRRRMARRMGFFL